jgi:hypothetical protein
VSSVTLDMDDQPSKPAAVPAEKLVEIADSKAFRVLLESHAQEAIERVMKRFLWTLAPVAVVLSFLGVKAWTEIGSWRETARQVREDLADTKSQRDAIKARADEADAIVKNAQRVFDSSSGLLRDLQSGMTATAGILQTQGELVRAGMSTAAESTEAQAKQIAAQVGAIEAHRARIEGDVASVQKNVAAVTGLLSESRLADRIGELERIETIQSELKRARSLQLVLLTAHSSQTLQMGDPCPLGRDDEARAYELTFTSNGLKGTPDRRGDRVVTIAFDVTRPGAEKTSGEVSFADHRGIRPFQRLEGSPFEVMLDFRYHYWPFSKDFVALRVRPTESCAQRSAAAR